MARRTVYVLLAVGVLAVAALLVYRIWFRSEFGPAEYLAAAQQGSAVGSKSNARVLLDACGTVEWKYLKSEGNKDLVEASGTLKSGGRPVVVRWEVRILRDGNTIVSVATPVFASVGGEEVQAVREYPSKLVAAEGH
jgi:hypothetical protein